MDGDAKRRTPHRVMVTARVMPEWPYDVVLPDTRRCCLRAGQFKQIMRDLVVVLLYAIACGTV